MIHRDVKSQNIMLGDDGQPHLMDFGLAKREASEIVITVEGQILGTPAYMPPEQARGELSKVDRKSDVYSLGVVLYQMICGELPFRGTTRMLLHQVLNDEPRAPRKLNDGIPRDLETICLKAMAKEPGQRYATALALSEDLRSFLDDKHIKARPASPFERAWRWCRRNPVLTLALAATVVSLAAVTVLSVLYAVSRGKMLSESNHHLAQVNLQLGLAACERGEIGPGLLWMNRSLRAAINSGDPSLTRVAGANLAAWQSELPGLQAVFSHASEVKCATFSPDGKTVLTASADHTARLWDVATRTPIGPPLTHQGVVWFAAFSPDGRIALPPASAARRGCGTPGREFFFMILSDTMGEVFQGVFSHDGKLVITVGSDGKPRIWNVADGRLLRELAGHTDQVVWVALGPDGPTVLTGSEDDTARLWNADTGIQQGEPLRHDGNVKTVRP